MKFGRSFKKFFGVVLLLATLFGAFHHHADLKPHNDCPVCTLQNNLSSGDTAEGFALASVENLFVPPADSAETIKRSNRPDRVSARAPPRSS